MTTIAKKPLTVPAEADYTQLVDLFSTHTEASHQLAQVEAELQAEWLELITRRRRDFAQLQTEVAETAEAIEQLAILHPEWFEKAKTLKTPFGSVASRTSTKLVSENEEVSIALIESKLSDAPLYLRERKFLNLEALEDLDDSDLAALRIKRVKTDKWTVTPAKVDLGKAVKTAEQREQDALTS